MDERDYTITTVAPSYNDAGKIEYTGKDRAAVITIPCGRMTVDRNPDVAIVLYLADAGRFVPFAVAPTYQRFATDIAVEWITRGTRPDWTALIAMNVMPSADWSEYDARNPR